MLDKYCASHRLHYSQAWDELFGKKDSVYNHTFQVAGP
jgi:hypothetical protein